MVSRVFTSLTDFGFSPADMQQMAQRLRYSHVVFIAGPPGGGKTACATMLGWFLFQGIKRPFRADGGQLTNEGVRDAARQGTHGIFFNEVATQADLTKVVYAADCRMVSLATSVIAESKVPQIYQILHFFNPTVAARKDLILVGVEPDPDSPEERFKVDCKFPSTPIPA
jgi:hypothetical protein